MSNCFLFPKNTMLFTFVNTLETKRQFPAITEMVFRFFLSSYYSLEMETSFQESKLKNTGTNGALRISPKHCCNNAITFLA